MNRISVALSSLLMINTVDTFVYAYILKRYQYIMQINLISFFFQAEDGIRDYKVTWSSDVCSSDLRRLVSDRIAPPFDATGEVGRVVFDANDLLALLVTPVVVVLVAWLLRASDAGVAIRASADDARSEERRVGQDVYCQLEAATTTY